MKGEGWRVTQCFGQTSTHTRCLCQALTGRRRNLVAYCLFAMVLELKAKREAGCYCWFGGTVQYHVL